MKVCLFCSIIERKAAAEIVHEDDQTLAFKDIRPQAPVHILIIPKKHISTLNELSPEDNLLVGQLFQAARTLAIQSGIHERGYRTVFNTNADAGQSVYHIHLHLLGGRTFSWPPG